MRRTPHSQTASRVPTVAEATLLAMVASGDARQFGSLYRGPRGRGWVIDVRPFGLIYGLAGVGFLERSVAEGVLAMIRVAIAQGASPEEACAPYLSKRSSLNLVPRRYARWVKIQEDRVAVGDLSPRTVQEYRRYGRPGGEVEWWEGRSIYDVTTALLEDWSINLAKRGLGPRTRRHVLRAFRTFFGWLRRSNAIREIPDFPTVEVPEHDPRILSPQAQVPCWRRSRRRLSGWRMRWRQPAGCVPTRCAP